jgi:hypothetical protein
MFGGHRKCEDNLHSLNSQIINHLNQIQELKAINNYQTYELERKIKELELNNGNFLDIIHNLEETHGKRIEEFHTSEYDLEYNNGLLKENIKKLESSHETLQLQCDEEYQKNLRLHERLASSLKEVSTLSDVLSSEPIIKALGKKKENNV